MSDREEIRWKLSNFSQFISNSINLHEKEQDNVAKIRNDVHRDLIQGRNTLVGGIGFGILLIISLISIEVLDKFYILIVPIAIVVALLIYVGFNFLTDKILKKYYELDNEYQTQIVELLEFEGWFTGYSFREDIDNKQIMFLLYYVTVFVNAIAYDIKSKSAEILGGEKPKIEDHSQYYEIIKENMVEAEKLTTNATLRIKNFIEKIEFQESKKK